MDTQTEGNTEMMKLNKADMDTRISPDEIILIRPEDVERYVRALRLSPGVEHYQ